jgi:hypothetical protein
MALTIIPTPATLEQVYRSLRKNPATDLTFAFGTVTPPQGFIVPTCQINTAPSGIGPVPPAAAARLGIPSRAQKYAAKLARLQKADPGSNTAVYLTSGVYETNWTFLAKDHKEGVIQALRDGTAPGRLASYFSPWKDATQKRVYLIMPEELAPLNAAAEREHCSDFIHAYNISLGAVDVAFQTLNGAATIDCMSTQEATRAMERKVEERVHPALASIALVPNGLAKKFSDLQEKSRTGRDGRGYHSFGLELLSEPPRNLRPVTYLTGAPRPEAGKIYLIFTRGTTQIGVFPSSAIITL